MNSRKLAKNGNFIYNILSVENGLNKEERSDNMFNFHKKKTQRIVSSIIIIILVLAMVVPMVMSVFY